ncbi:hypothetical protein SORDD17_00614 [Streptococcus oralis]|uniref:Uncharacterized protein n=1 Tax=Streptococcus oralis TaxID=1303 RepID=A0A139RN49_STROR|nr:hypothetical protein [Streptococcus oralis]KXU16182.1 hypothetical protein SORDD17_00614 [Streptococcus oralis]
MKISQEEFDKKFDAVLRDIEETLDDPEQYAKRVKEFSDENGKLDLYDLGNLLRAESKLYAGAFTYRFLRSLFVDSNE